MRQTTIRFSEAVWQILCREAEEQGVSVAEYVREAAFVRAAYAAAERGDLFFSSKNDDGRALRGSPVREATEQA
jgi:hypothetical protein